jgi:NAD(P)-dependent dehydrogenase (short-subunit alcohol dehydrogenase family)
VSGPVGRPLGEHLPDQLRNTRGGIPIEGLDRRRRRRQMFVQQFLRGRRGVWRHAREHFEQQVNVNWRSAFELIQLAAPSMIERNWGRILTVGSVQEAKPHPDMVIYSALKAAQTLMVQNLAKQFAPHGVTVNNLAPGVINTDRSRARLTDPAYVNKVLSWIPAGHIGEAEDCAGAALLLCSDAGRYITGQSLFVDGGMSL